MLLFFKKENFYEDLVRNSCKSHKNCKQLKNTVKNSKGRQVHLFYLPKLGRISKHGLCIKKLFKCTWLLMFKNKMYWKNGAST